MTGSTPARAAALAASAGKGESCGRRQRASVRPALLLLAALLLAPALEAQVPTPAEIIGFAPGTDYHLADYTQVYAYFRALGAASERVHVEEVGRSSEGRPMILALISSEENLRRRERLREISARLARARGVNEAEATALAEEGVAVVWIDGGLHATEISSAQTAPVLAHWLATDEGEETRRIRENVMLVLMPVTNPDGLDLVVDWYKGNLGTQYEGSRPPTLYHHYVGHDNNRDWYMFTQAETRVVARQLYHEWYPQIVYNPHQSAPNPARIWVPPQAEPVNPNRDALVFIGRNRIGYHMKQRFEQEDKPGVVSGIVFDNWYSGYMSSAPDFRNMIAILTETASSVYASPRCVEEARLPATFGERGNFLSASEPSNSYPNPWRGGCWTLQDQVDYSMTASLAILDIAAKLKGEYLYNIYLMGRRQIARGEAAEGGAFAYIVDMEAQHDAGAALELLRTFRRGGVEVLLAGRPFRAAGREYGAGTYVIGPQAFRPAVVDLLDTKPYPERLLYPGGPPQRPYDMTGYELSLKMGVVVDRAMEAFPLPARHVEEIDIPAPGGQVLGTGRNGYLLGGTANISSIAVNRLLASGATVSWTGAALRAGGGVWPAGSFLVVGAGRPMLEALARDLGVDFHGLDDLPDVELLELRAPRIAVYRGFTSNMPEGWLRWVLEQYEFDFVNIGDAEVRAGELAAYDIIVLPEQSPAGILQGNNPRNMPEEYTGGIGAEGAAALRRYVEAGGWLLALDQATRFANSEFGLPVRDASANLPADSFFIPGSLLRIEPDPTHPLAFGMAAEATAVFVRSRLLEPQPAAAGGTQPVVDSYVRYAGSDVVASGWAHGADHYAAGRPAALRVGLGSGQVVLIGFSPLYRAQAHGTFKLLFNPLYSATLDARVWERFGTTAPSAASGRSPR